ncbi:MAG TPA: peroxiredoxin-like family protein [Acidobacteriaceae bacterium]|nr:peroxiredoxin-like family protein [Acidobacteriaceae bacterium]
MTLLQDQLDQISEQTRSLVQPERLQPSEDAIAELFSTGIEQQILPVGSIAPQFSLPDSTGRMVDSADLLALGPVVVNFFRGRWCPYCLTELEAWHKLYPELRKRGALLAAISPQTVHQNDLLLQQHPFPFPVLSDPGLAVAKRFRIVYSVPAYHQKHYRSILVNIPFINDDPSWRLLLPATYLLRSDGSIAFAQAHADFRVRPEPDELLAVLDRERSL